MTRPEIPAENIQAPAEAKDRRFVYNAEPSDVSPDRVMRANRPVRKRPRSTSSLIVALTLISLLVVLYIWNKIMVNRLAEDVNNLQNQYQKIVSANEVLRAEINQKSRLERIGDMATKQLGLTYPKQQPIWFTAEERNGSPVGQPKEN